MGIYDKYYTRIILNVVIVAIAISFQGCSVQGTSAMPNAVEQTLTTNGWHTYVGDGTGIWISIDRQQLTLIKNNRIAKQYIISTGKEGAGNVIDSGQTPLGWHRIGAKIGDNMPEGARFSDGEFTGKFWRPGDIDDHALMISRLMKLDGLEAGINRGGNVDTWSRNIYIHGTNRVERLGRPDSGGCVRLDPHEVIDLYGRVKEGCCVLITENGNCDKAKQTNKVNEVAAAGN